MRFVIAAAIFYFGMLVFWPICSTALMWATVYWAKRGALGLLWCGRTLFPVGAHGGQRAKVFPIPQRSQRHRVQIARYR